MARQAHIVQLLRDYSWWIAPFGGSSAIEEQALKNTQFGPGSVVLHASGAHLTPQQKDLLDDSYAHLQRALDELERNARRPGHDGEMAAWLCLYVLYLGDPADHSILDEWRKDPDDVRPVVHDMAIAILSNSEHLSGVDLWVVSPKVMTRREESRIEDTNDEVYAVFCRLKRGSMSADAAAHQTADYFSNDKLIPLSVDAVERIVEVRGGSGTSGICRLEGCRKPSQAQGLCAKHYQRQRRRRKLALDR